MNTNCDLEFDTAQSGQSSTVIPADVIVLTVYF